MAEFKGTEFQIEIQKRMLTRHEWIKESPNVANGGRVLNFLEPKLTGWDVIRKYLDEDGVVALTAQPRDTIMSEVHDVFGENFDYPSWDIYTATQSAIVAKNRDYLGARDLPNGWKAGCFERLSDLILEEVQSLNAKTGVAPYPGFYARSEVVPCLTSCIWDEKGTMVATSSVNARYHEKSRFAGYIFNGSVSVLPEQRGKNLGRFVNAQAMLESREGMGWSNVVSQVQADNVASVKTLTSLGFTREPDLITIGLVAKGVQFTR